MDARQIGAVFSNRFAKHSANKTVASGLDPTFMTHCGPEGSTIDRPSANTAGMCNNPKRIVVSSYDEVADVYVERFGFSRVRQKWVGRLINGLPAGGGRVLDLGCGAGIPVARDLAALGHAVVVSMGRYNRSSGLDGTSPRRRLSKRICAK